MCDNPECPLAPNDNGNRLNDDKRAKGDEIVCENPDCPSKTKKKDYCGDPNCPSSKKNGRCSDPKCPSSETRGRGDSTICENPNCPFAKNNEQKQKYCGNPNCPRSRQSRNCANPKCPFARGSDNNKYMCANPNCPSKVVAKIKNKPTKASEDPDTCVNPNCPFDQNKGGIGSGDAPDVEKVRYIWKTQISDIIYSFFPCISNAYNQ